MFLISQIHESILIIETMDFPVVEGQFDDAEEDMYDSLHNFFIHFKNTF